MHDKTQIKTWRGLTIEEVFGDTVDGFELDSESTPVRQQRFA